MDDRYSDESLNRAADDVRKALRTLQEELAALEMRKNPPPAAENPPVVDDSARFGLEVWLDDPPSLVLDANYLGTLQDLGVTGLVVMIDGPEPGLGDLKWDIGQLERLRGMLCPRIELIPSLWPIPTREFIESVLPNRLPAILRACGASKLELDCEPAGDWSPEHVEGFKNIHEAGKALYDVVLGAPADHLEVTTFPAAVRHCKGLVGEDSTLMLQVYAVSQRQGEDVAFDSPLGPERWTERSVTIARRTWTGPIALGMAAYRSAFPGKTESVAWSTQLQAWRGMKGPLLLEGARFWSSKWLVRKKGHERRRRELKLAL